MLSLRSSLLVLASPLLLGLVACGPSTSPTSPAEPEPEPGPGPVVTPLLVIADDAPTNASSCEDRLEFAQDTMQDVVDRANGECTRDDQCAVVFIDTACRGACQAAILEAHVDELERAKEAIDERACIGYAEAGCSYATPRCLQMRAVCDAGRCGMAPMEEAG